MKGPNPKNEPDRQDTLEVERVPAGDLEKVRSQEIEPAAPTNGSRNVFIGTLNVFVGPMRAFIDPVKKVCYPTLSAHWDSKYKRPFAHHAWKVLIFDLVLLFLAGFLTVSLILVYKFLTPVSPPDRVSVMLTWPDEVMSGTEIDLVLSYTNRTDRTLKDGRMTVELPDGFVTAEPDRTNDDSEPRRTAAFGLGELAPDSTGRITVSGSAYGSPGDVLPVLIRLSYWEDGQAKMTEQTAYYEIPVDATPLEMGFDFEQPFLNDTVNKILLTYTNSGDRPVNGVNIRLTPPPGFEVSGSAPRFSEPLTWRIGNLTPGETGKLIFFGRLAYGETPSFTAVATTAGIYDDQKMVLNSIHGNADAMTTGFELSQDMKGVSSLRPGETLTVAVDYANSNVPGTDLPIRDVVLKVEVDGDYLAPGVAPTAVWSAETLPELKELDPGQVGHLEANFRIKEGIGPWETEGIEGAMISVTTTAEYRFGDSQTRIFRTDSVTSDLPISTAMNIDASAIYRTESGDQLGLGPLPPTAGQPTSFWIMVALDNGTNPARDVQLTAILPEGSVWTGRTNVAIGEPLIHISDERKVVWRIDDLPAFAGWFGPRPTAGFEIEFTPTRDDVGTAPNLVEYLTMTGTDAVTGVRVTSEAQPVTTGVRFGSIEERQGLVR